MHHILGNKVLEYDVDDRGVIVDEREIDRTVNHKPNIADLLNKKQIITIVNNDVTGDKTKTPIFFSNTDHDSGWISSAFYNSIGFDSVPTKETDGFTEQDLIDYVLENLITK